MFNRVQAYGVILVLMNLALGLCCWFATDSFKAETYDPIRSVMPLEAWGFIFVGISVLAVVGRVLWSVGVLRAAHAISASVMVAWAVGFISAIIAGKAHGPTAPIVWIALAAKDLVIVSTPVIEPIESYVTRPKAR